MGEMLAELVIRIGILVLMIIACLAMFPITILLCKHVIFPVLIWFMNYLQTCITVFG